MKSAEFAKSAASRDVVPLRQVTGRRGEELAFLPAALEIVETPPSPIRRMIGATIILLFCAALAWAWWGTIDIVASATGKIVPSGRTKVIQPFETGVVRSIRVQDGQPVKAGDVLIELDPTVNAAERDHLHDDLLAEQLNTARLRRNARPARSFTQHHRGILANQWRAPAHLPTRPVAEPLAGRIAEAAAMLRMMHIGEALAPHPAHRAGNRCGLDARADLGGQREG